MLSIPLFGERQNLPFSRLVVVGNGNWTASSRLPFNQSTGR